jgi:hypothetical protein
VSTIEERLFEERIRRLLTWLETRESCEEVEEINIHGLRVRTSEEVVIRLRGRHAQEIRGKVRCYNRFWGTVVVETESSELMVKVKDIVFIERVKGAERGTGGGTQGDQEA